MTFFKIKKKISKKVLILIPIYLFTFVIGDIIFSNFFYVKPVKYGCMKKFEYFYELEKNCKAYEKLIGSVSPYRVYTDNNGYRYSGKKRQQSKDDTVIFLGDSFTYGWALDYEKSFVGMLEKKYDKYACRSCKLFLVFNHLRKNNDKQDGLCDYCQPMKTNKLREKTKELQVVRKLKEDLPDHPFIHNKSVGNECTLQDREGTNGHLYPDIRFEVLGFDLIVEVDEYTI